MAENKHKFDYRIQQTDPHVGSLLATIDEAKGQFKGGLRITPQAITNLRRSVLVTSAGSSTRIEGSKLTNAQVEKIMHSLAVSKFADRDSQEVQGYLETLGNVFDEYAKLPLREGVIKSLHRELLKYAQKDTGHRGEYKHKENIVGVLGKDGTIAHILFETTPAYLTAKEMSELVEWASDALEQNRFHPLLVIANFVIEFLKIHPFEDGNGRLSRILTNLLLLRSGYSFAQYVSHEQMIEHRKDEYYFALRASQATFRTQHKPEGAKETIAPWLNYFLGIISEQATKALTYLGEEQVEDTLSAKQRAVWKHIVTVGDVNLGELVAATGINRATVRQALLRLVELGKIKRTGRGRATRYVKVSS